MEMKKRPLGLAVFALSMTILTAGCKDEVVRRYKVPRDERPTQRMLVAMFQYANHTWFLKVLGPQTVVDAHEKEFDRFVNSLRFPDKGRKPEWPALAGWVNKEGSGFRSESFVFGPKETPLEMSITPLGAEAGSLLENVNRWRGQMGLPRVDGDDLEQYTKTIKVDGKEITLIDLRTEAAGAEDAAEDSSTPIYTLPDSWKKSAKQVPFALAVFRVEDGGEGADITISPLSGPAGGLLPNYNRWRGQAGLKPVGEEAMKKELGEIEVAGIKARYADVSGAGGEKRRRILGVVLPHGGDTWFFKMDGPASLVEKQKPVFEAFVKSVRFDGGKGAKP